MDETSSSGEAGVAVECFSSAFPTALSRTRTSRTAYAGKVKVNAFRRMSVISIRWIFSHVSRGARPMRSIELLACRSPNSQLLPVAFGRARVVRINSVHGLRKKGRADGLPLIHRPGVEGGFLSARSRGLSRVVGDLRVARFRAFAC